MEWEPAWVLSWMYLYSSPFSMIVLPRPAANPMEQSRQYKEWDDQVLSVRFNWLHRAIWTNIFCANTTRAGLLFVVFCPTQQTGAFSLLLAHIHPCYIHLYFRVITFTFFEIMFASIKSLSTNILTLVGILHIAFQQSQRYVVYVHSDVD